jgi:hypothetical protein
MRELPPVSGPRQEFKYRPHRVPLVSHPQSQRQRTLAHGLLVLLVYSMHTAAKTSHDSDSDFAFVRKSAGPIGDFPTRRIILSHHRIGLVHVLLRSRALTDGDSRARIYRGP